MKPLIALTSVLLMTSVASAWNFPENPDRKPSLGFHASNQSLTGTRAEIDQPGNALQRAQAGSEERTLNSVGVDLKLPVHPGLTLTVFYNKLDANDEFIRGGNVYKQTSNLSGYNAGFEARVYLSH